MEPVTDTRKPHSRFLWLLLALPFAGLLFPQLYARNTPVLFGFPFFYWYQLAWVLLTSILLVAYYKLTKAKP